MSRNTGSVASSDKSWLKLYAAVAVLPLLLTACGGGGGGGGSPTPPLTPTPSPAPTPAPTPAPAPSPASPTIGSTWATAAVSGAGNLTGVDYADGHFVAVSDTGAAITSTDGVTWTPIPLLTSNVATDHLKAYAVTHLGNTLVAAGSVSAAPYSTSTGAVATSTDGTTWTMGSMPAGATPIHGLIGDTTQVIGLGESGHIYASNNGSSWSLVTTAPGAGNLNAGTYGNNTYVGVGDNGYIIKSVDGVVWGSAQVIVVGGTGINLHGVAWTGSQYVAVGDNATITLSADGTHWGALRTSAIPGTLRAVAVASNGTIVVVGDNGIETSTDGNTWTARNDSGVAALAGATFGNSEFVVVGPASAVKTSSN